jgi:hypothetical protein
MIKIVRSECRVRAFRKQLAMIQLHSMLFSGAKMTVPSSSHLVGYMDYYDNIKEANGHVMIASNNSLAVSYCVSRFRRPCADSRLSHRIFPAHIAHCIRVFFV